MIKYAKKQALCRVERLIFVVLFVMSVVLGMAYCLKLSASATCDEKCGSSIDKITTQHKINVDSWIEFTTVYNNAAKNLKLASTPTPLAQSNGEEAELPDEYGEFIGSLPDEIIDMLPEEAFGDDSDSVTSAAKRMSGVVYLLEMLFDAFGSALTELLPTLALLFAIIMITAICRVFASNVGVGISGAVGFASRLSSFCLIATISIGSLDRLQEYFDSLFGAVASFLPLSGVLLAAGGNLNGAASSSVTITAVLAVCQFFFSETVIPIFCICLSLTMLSVFEGNGAVVGHTVATNIKKWYTTALSFIMMLMTTSVAAQSILASKADGAAIRGMKFAASSFIPISGGSVSTTLGTLAASVELLRGSVGVIGIAVIILLLIPIIVELAALRGIFALVSFVSGLLGCSVEKALLDEIGSLYGYLEGIAALSSVVFLIAFAIFAVTTAAVL